MDQLILKRAALSRSSGRWNDDGFDVLAGGKVVDRIYKASTAPVGSPWIWTLAFGHHKDRTPTHGYEATREAAMAAFARSWRREEENAQAFDFLGMVAGRTAGAGNLCGRSDWFVFRACRAVAWRAVQCMSEPEA